MPCRHLEVDPVEHHAVPEPLADPAGVEGVSHRDSVPRPVDRPVPSPFGASTGAPDNVADLMGSLIKKRRKRMRKKKHKKMLKRTRWQRRAAGK